MYGMIIDKDKYDAMLQEMTLSLIEIYYRESDVMIGTTKEQLLSDILDTFFGE